MRLAMLWSGEGVCPVAFKVDRIVIGGMLLFAVLFAPTMVAAAPTAEAANGRDRFIVVARSDADYDALRADVQRAGGAVVNDIRDSGLLVVSGASTLKSKIQSNARAQAVAKDHIETLIRPSAKADLLNSAVNAKAGVSRTAVNVSASPALASAASALAAARAKKTVVGDPAISYPGLLWNLVRIHAPEAWQVTTGASVVKVGVADTGLDFTHSDLAPRIANVVDFTINEDPPICKTFFDRSDDDLAAEFGGPPTTDWNGHGSWIGGNIAGALDGQGVNGIAPSVKLVALKISQWCGAAFDSTILDAFTYAFKHNIDIVSISFGGYLNLSNPDEAIIWGQYNRVVQKARDRGTLIVAAAGNEHVQIGTAGQVTSHGSLTNPADPAADFQDLFGQFQIPGGIPGVIDVSSTGNIVAGSTANCMPEPGNNPTCKKTSDAHQQAGVGKENLLAYYSNYGPRIDVAGPGGARKFNLPFWDNGGTPGFPYTRSDLTTAFEDFSTTSNWAVEIPCFVFTGGGFPADQCYSTIQGTSMSTPHASGVLALIISHNRDLRGNSDRLVRILKNSARNITGNQTQVLSATDHSPDDQTGTHPCVPGYCHLGGLAVPDSEAYGAGLVDAQRAVNR